MLDEVVHHLQASRLALAQAFAGVFLARAGLRHVRENDRADDGLLFEAPRADDRQDEALVLEDHQLVQAERRELLVQEVEADRRCVLAAVGVADAGHFGLVRELGPGLLVHPA